MGVVNVKSAVITNRDSSPKVLSNSNLVKANIHEAVGICEAGASDSTGSTYRFCSIPSNAVPSEVFLYADILDGGATTMAFDLGLYDTTANGSAVVDVDFFASAVAGSTSKINGTKIGFEALDIVKGEKMIWEILGLSSDPCKRYDVVATTTGDNDAAGTILLKTRFKV